MALAMAVMEGARAPRAPEAWAADGEEEEEFGRGGGSSSVQDVVEVVDGRVRRTKVEEGEEEVVGGRNWRRMR